MIERFGPSQFMNSFGLSFQNLSQLLYSLFAHPFGICGWRIDRRRLVPMNELSKQTCVSADCPNVLHVMPFDN